MSDRPPFDPKRSRAAEGAKSPKHGAPTSEAQAAGPAAPFAEAAAQTLSPLEVNNLVSGAITRHLPSTIHVLAEIGDISRAASGHIYLTLKDPAAELRAVMWRSAAAKLRFEPRQGMAVIATGGVEVYAARGSYQLIVRRIEPRGVGALEVAFRQLREKLEREGLFADARKRPLPRVPERVALITSPDGAVLRDIVRTVARRWPAIELLLFPVRVQGDGAAAEIAAAVERMSEHAASLAIDVAIVARGGGSAEDLWCFNEEIVARAVAHSSVPVVSAIGHETDVTICDFVADVRAATPTAAAELITPDRRDVQLTLRRHETRAVRAATATIDLARHRFDRMVAYDGIARPLRRINERSQRLDELTHRLRIASLERFRDARRDLARAELIILRFAAGTQFVRLAQRLDHHAARLRAGLVAVLNRSRQRLLRAAARCERALPLRSLARSGEHLANCDSRIRLALRQTIGSCRSRLDARARAAEACHPVQTLRRGYSVTRDARSGRVIRSTADIVDGKRIVTQVADGEFRSTADDPRQPRLFD